ncbi:MAG TPA: DUF4233 domain-containing protein [Gordonia sp. (in: high G+C Gram-positive bacteria)]|uniref:DUF4233 domain-containing protein n=1 Tax=unclassified Gordonia (in: high G+C Gram-positive bacteria) TaxID=2657482 RepID=UPI000F9D0299|nr:MULTISPECIES: DUF4233 domain-containing protein [unclassified Gordonia (in: high G+C Gram-positive bacteria)]RUP37619.1 MAG: DUF4233 domain-containing protein [Gordonia sp. (in: high G+C Gram-positive bacteria)]HNP59030.1 DUF4233 domain-containing protein [Gordonia sp. (in: high G+C Gram-positive bacteria)]HRC51470.1 DUF4233 domain-containing protein [Gordonia sp. (in: high G+C Gram-positive bacteria)]
MTDEPATGARFTPPTNDPWKGLRGVMSGLLILQAIVVGLAFPVVGKIGGGLTAASITYLSALIVALVLACRYQSRTWALTLNCALTLLTIVGGVFHWSIAVIGFIFALVWAYVIYIKRDVEHRMANGQLPGQEPIVD